MVSVEMREPTFLILAALAAGPRHGYALIQEIDELSAGRVRLKPGSLYGALNRLVDEGLVVKQKEEMVDGRKRRYYDLSSQGINALTEHTRRLQSNAHSAARRLKLRGVTA